MRSGSWRTPSRPRWPSWTAGACGADADGHAATTTSARAALAAAGAAARLDGDRGDQQGEQPNAPARPAPTAPAHVPRVAAPGASNGQQVDAHATCGPRAARAPRPTCADTGRHFQAGTSSVGNPIASRMRPMRRITEELARPAPAACTCGVTHHDERNVTDARPRLPG